MKLSPEALLEVVNILRLGLSEGKDVSQMLRDLDLVPGKDNLLDLSVDYKAVRAGQEQS